MNRSLANQIRKFATTPIISIMPQELGSYATGIWIATKGKANAQKQNVTSGGADAS